MVAAGGGGFNGKAEQCKRTGERKRPENARTKTQSDPERTTNNQCSTAPFRDDVESEAAASAVTMFREVRQPIERDDEETRQLLRLSQLEGRDPLQDAVAGRLALDRLDATAEGDVDPQRARWADELRRDLRERFNEIAPTKFEVKGAQGAGR